MDRCSIVRDDEAFEVRIPLLLTSMPFACPALSDVKLLSSAVTLAAIILRYAVLQRGRVYDSGATYISATKSF